MQNIRSEKLCNDLTFKDRQDSVKKSGYMMINCSKKEINAIKDTEWIREEYEKYRDNLYGYKKRHIIESWQYYLRIHPTTEIPYKIHYCSCKMPYSMCNITKESEEYYYLYKINCSKRKENKMNNLTKCVKEEDKVLTNS